MTLSKQISAIALILAFGVNNPARAHDDHGEVADPDVKARITSMIAAETNLQKLERMAAGEISLHQAKARMARDVVFTQMRRAPSLFEHPATDPNSGAAADVWLEWTGFEDLSAAAMNAAVDIDLTSRRKLKKALVKVRAQCAACHDKYLRDH